MKKILFFSCLLFLMATAFSVPTQINVQAKIKSGSFWLDSNQNVTVNVYDALTAGNLLFAETQLVPFVGGVGNIVLGDQNDLNSTILDGNRFFGFALGVDAEMSPRVFVRAVPYSILAQHFSDENQFGRFDYRVIANPVWGVGSLTQADANSWFWKQKDLNAVLQVTDFNSVWVSWIDANKTFGKILDVNAAIALLAKITDVNGADALRALISDVNGADALRALISDVNGADALRILVSDTNNLSRIDSNAIADWNSTSSLLYASIADPPTVATDNIIDVNGLNEPLVVLNASDYVTWSEFGGSYTADWTSNSHAKSNKSFKCVAGDEMACDLYTWQYLVPKNMSNFFSNGKLGFWIDVNRTDGFTAAQFLIGSTSSNRNAYNFLPQIIHAGWTYVIVDLNSPSGISGTIDWSNIKYLGMITENNIGTFIIYYDDFIGFRIDPLDFSSIAKPHPTCADGNIVATSDGNCVDITGFGGGGGSADINGQDVSPNVINTNEVDLNNAAFQAKMYVVSPDKFRILTDACDITIGNGAYSSGGGTQINYNCNADSSGTCMGYFGNGTSYGASVGYGSYGGLAGAALGAYCYGGQYGVGIGEKAYGYFGGIAIGASSRANGTGNIAIGGDNTGSIYGNDKNALVPDGWINTTEIGIGTATKQGALNYRGIPVVDDNGNFYGSMWGEDFSKTVVISSASVYYDINADLNTGYNNYFVRDQNHLTAKVSGKYKVDWSLTAQCATNNQSIEGVVLVNGVEQKNAVAATEIVSISRDFGFAGTGIISLNIDDNVSLGVANHSGTNNLIINHANIALVRVGK